MVTPAARIIFFVWQVLLGNGAALSPLVEVRVVGMGSYLERPAVMVSEEKSGAPVSVVAVPIAAEAAKCMAAAQSGEDRVWAGVLADRDGGFLDLAPWDETRRSTKRKAYDAVRFGKTKRNPYESLLGAASEAFGDLRDTLIEDAWPGPNVRLEGALRFSDDVVVDCFADEAIGLSLAKRCPLYIRKELYDSLSTTYDLDDDMTILPRVVKNKNDKEEKKEEQEREVIKTGDEYLALSLPEKIELLLEAEVPQLPRPRRMEEDPRGPDAPIDDLLLPLVDEIARREVLIEKAIQMGDIKEATALMAKKSDRHKAHDRVKETSQDGDIVGEVRARSDKALFDAAKADLTQDDGDYSRFLDRDPWYEEQLQRNRRNAQRDD